VKHSVWFASLWNLTCGRSFFISFRITFKMHVNFMVYLSNRNLTLFLKQNQLSGSEEETKWAQDLVAHMVKMSPTSMKVTLRQIREGKTLATLKECLQMEYRYRKPSLCSVILSAIENSPFSCNPSFNLQSF